MDIAALQARSFSEQLELSLGQVTAVGEVANLGDPRFDEAVAEDGLWRPFDFLFKGHPGHRANFRTLIERLDRRRFQPWAYYYPSGASLPAVADHLTQTM